MTSLQAIVLGLVQGVTEFLPISSTAHLILVPYVVGWPDAGLRFAVVTNAGTLVAAMLYFRKTLVGVFRAPDGALWGHWRQPGLMRGALLGTVPVALFGLAFHGFLTDGARTPLVIGLTTLLFGLLLGWADHVGARSRDLASLRWRDVAVIGVAQALALIPGTSRSGITMTAALTLGLKRTSAARFSFLLAIPVGVLAWAKDTADLLLAPEAMEAFAVSGQALAIGFIVSLVSAYAVIDFLLRWLERSSLSWFVVYRLLLGAAILLLIVFR